MWIIKNMKSKVSRPDFWGAVSICSNITCWIIRNRLLLGASSVIITTAAVVTTNCVTTAIDTVIHCISSRQPHVKLSQPVLQSIDWHNTQNGSGTGVAQEHITKWDHLQNKTILDSNCFQFLQKPYKFTDFQLFTGVVYKWRSGRHLHVSHCWPFLKLSIPIRYSICHVPSSHFHRQDWPYSIQPSPVTITFLPSNNISRHLNQNHSLKWCVAVTKMRPRKTSNLHYLP